MNSQIVSIDHALKSKKIFLVLTALIPVSLYLSAGFISVSVIWFCFLCVYNYQSSLKRQFKTLRILFFPIILYALYVIGISISGDLAVAVDLLLRKVHLFLIPIGFMVVNKRMSEKDLHIILAVFLISCLLCAFVCLSSAIYNIIHFRSLTEHAADGNHYYFTYFKLTEPVNISPVYLSLYCNLAFLVTLKTPFLNSSLRTIIALYIVIFIIMISSTIGIISMAVISVLWVQTTAYKKMLRYIAGGILMISLLIGFYKSSFLKDQFEIDYQEYSGDVVNTIPSRLAIWSSAWEAIKQNPIGYGTVEGQKALEAAYKKNGFTWGIRESLNAHNEFLSALLDVGIFGFLILVGMLIYPFIQAVQSKDTLATSFIVMIFLFFCVESVLVRQKGIVFFSFFYSVVFSRLAITRRLQSFKTIWPYFILVLPRNDIFLQMFVEDFL